eukprot:1345453-Amorphochlora_amoeboformis.AAC.1
MRAYDPFAWATMHMCTRVFKAGEKGCVHMTVDKLRLYSIKLCLYMDGALRVEERVHTVRMHMNVVNNVLDMNVPSLKIRK